MNSSIYAEVNTKFNKRKEQIKDLHEQRKQQIYADIPEIRDIDDKLSSLAYKMFLDVTAGTEPSVAAENVRNTAAELNDKKKKLLAKAGFKPDFLARTYYCSKCGDTGLVDGKRCECYNKLLIKELMAHSNLSASMKKQTFDMFSLDYYSSEKYGREKITPADNMKSILSECIRFADEFGSENKNFLFYGAPGLGKTFLSSAIANAVMQKGFTVLYQSAGAIFSELENIKFKNADTDFTAEILNVDLLIIDDLGTEFINSFTESELFRILNSRIIDEKSIIINTNLSLSDVKKTYSDRVLSRILGNFDAFKFYGEDIRLKKID